MQSGLGAEVDATRLGLWGTSFAGGHVLCIARQQGANILAVVSEARRCCCCCPLCHAMMG